MMKRQRPDNDGANADGFGGDEGELTAAQDATNVELGSDVAAASSRTAGLPPGMAWRLVQDELSSPRASDVTFRIAVAANEGSAK